ncbi:MAG: hypothetical protein IJD41_04355 [Alphaproteobacteria bacterium]|nr:hypothetical protein [Alphaproteobacteria bacterium]MBQ7128179.1 hypothetical protein [Alphaproteobacteria bacterium]
MTVKNIMFSGVMAAILMAGANAHAAVEIASTGYVDTEVAKKADATEFSTLKGVVENADTGLATKASKTELQTAQSDLQAAIDLKANAANVYTKTEADDKFEEQSDAIAKLTEAKAYTDTQVKALTDSLGGTGEDGESTGLTGTVLEHTSQITALQDKVGNETVANQISSAITELDLANTYGAKSAVEANTTAISNINNAETGLLAQAKADATAKADKALEDAKAYTDGKVTDMATNSSVDTKLTEYTKTSELNATFATDAEVETIQTTLQGNIDAKVATETYNAKVGELESAIGGKQTALTDPQLAAVNSGVTSDTVAQVATNKTKSETNEAAISSLSNDLKTKITKPEACETGNCVLAMMNNGDPEWIVLTLPTE